MRTRVLNSNNYPGLPFIRYEIPLHWRRYAQIQWPHIQIYGNLEYASQSFVPSVKFMIQESFDFFNPEDASLPPLNDFSSQRTLLLETQKGRTGVCYQRHLYFLNEEGLITQLVVTSIAPSDDPIAVLESENVILSLKAVIV